MVPADSSFFASGGLLARRKERSPEHTSRRSTIDSTSIAVGRLTPQHVQQRSSSVGGLPVASGWGGVTHREPWTPTLHQARNRARSRAAHTIDELIPTHRPEEVQHISRGAEQLLRAVRRHLAAGQQIGMDPAETKAARRLERCSSLDISTQIDFLREPLDQGDCEQESRYTRKERTKRTRERKRVQTVHTGETATGANRVILYKNRNE